jgi:N-acetylglutamate synthase
LNTSIESLQITDYAEVFAFWRNIQGIYLHNDYSETPEGFARFLERNPGHSFVARNGGRLVGAVLGSQDGRRGFINHMAVAPEYRRLGIGRQLAGKVTQSLKAVGILKVALFVLKTSPEARAFWSSIGFKPEELVDVYSIIS